MYGTGLLFLSSAVKKHFLVPILQRATQMVHEKLILCIPNNTLSLIQWKGAISSFYNAASEICPSLDVYFLLPRSDKRSRAIEIDVILSCERLTEQAVDQARLLNPSLPHGVDHIMLSDSVNSIEDNFDTSDTSSSNTYDCVCVGGTFDRLHNGHKILLSIGGLLTRKELLVGITSDEGLESKQLAPLILSFESRCANVRSFLSCVGFPASHLVVAKLTDPFGPPGNCSKFQCIITSAEALPNCGKLNELRTSKGFNPLEIEQIEFVPAFQPPSANVPPEMPESKLSSSTIRFDLLGTLLRSVNTTARDNRKARNPYVIGLVGPSGAGKSALAKRLANMSSQVQVLDCDRLGHEAYRPGTDCYKALIQHFGFDAIASPDPPHYIDRSRLGTIVFSDARRLAELNSIVWPEILRQIEDFLLKIDHPRLSDRNHFSRPIVILDAAVLLQAGWDKLCEEVWVAIIPKQEALRRICERNGLSLSTANERLSRQASAVASSTGGLDWWSVGQLDTGLGPLGRAHVVLSTQWDPECSQQQVQKAFTGLKKRMTLES
ncbi:unnamed protein product [Dicrocoelium dendriticum]|nr:unnamed protein product [Dicrocoelium dendriticum]